MGLSLPSPLQPGEEMEACEELALALSRGLQLDTQRSSRDSLQCSSGYSTQTTTPCCSEDTIPSQGRRQPGLSSRASSAVPGEEGALPAGGGRRLATAEQLGMLWRARLSLSGSCHPRQWLGFHSFACVWQSGYRAVPKLNQTDAVDDNDIMCVGHFVC